MGIHFRAVLVISLLYSKIMTFVSSCVKGCSLTLLLLSFIILYNYVATAISAHNIFGLEGVWGSLPLFLTGSTGLSTACCGRNSKFVKITLVVLAWISLVTTVGMLVPLSIVLDDLWYYSDCYWGYACDYMGVRLYCITQLFFVIISFFTLIVLLVTGTRFSLCCGPSTCSCLENLDTKKNANTAPVQMFIPGQPGQGHAIYVIPQQYPGTLNQQQLGHPQPYMLPQTMYQVQPSSFQGIPASTRQSGSNMHAAVVTSVPSTNSQKHEENKL